MRYLTITIIAAGITAAAVFAAAVPLVWSRPAPRENPRAAMPRPITHTDHAHLVQGPLADGPAVPMVRR